MFSEFAELLVLLLPLTSTSILPLLSHSLLNSVLHMRRQAKRLGQTAPVKGI